jgi:hypothetical protein
MPAVKHEEKNDVLPRDIPADAFVLGRIFYFRDRKGGNYAVSDSAHVAFDIRIIRTSDGKTVYHGEFDEIQQPLSNNLLSMNVFYKRKGQWVTSEQMARSALDDMVNGLASTLKN